ncbi:MULTISPECIES: glycosyl hydrolase [unclassified Spirosoma]|uniref:glycosyl hydrolase n=1 Tax=unclassified Spirosoma TaxID=2621999 RepID=UPI00096317B4|nr:MULTISPECIES: glycosyl hydrolase [unclassified Spirosoma]MBN8826015.1 glycosyl hydrolase family 43 [Spirosoma sp.]OJW75470.1 MAG: glycosyl hydrolase family 43 [Spirosoma sp. 48-14]
MKRRTFLKNSSTAGLAALVTPAGIIEFKRKSTILDTKAAESFVDAFVNPPMSARAQVWWHWMNGNVTADGITRDLEAMQQIGLGGFQNFDAGTGIPKGPVVYLSPEWLSLKQHAMKEADRLGLEFTMHNCPGWSSSGGPWITPELAMQEVTWSEAYLAGGQPVTISLPRPPAKLNYYRDVAVLAYPSLSGEASLAALVTKITATGGTDSNLAEQLAGGEGLTVQSSAEGQPATILLEFKAPYEAQSIAFVSKPVGKTPSGEGGFGGGPQLTLEASDDGTQFRKVASGSAGRSADETLTIIEFAPTKARYFRIASPGARHFSQLRFSGAARLADWRKKTDMVFGAMGVTDDSEEAGKAAIKLSSIVDLTKFMDKEGSLRWNAPSGNWTILRVGYTPKGELNRSAPDTGIGLECDKYNPAAIDFHFNRMMENLLPTLKPLAQKGKVGLLIDSYEVGMQNWTAQLPQEFQKRVGDSLLAYLPALTGRIVENVDLTERFLWDFRRVLADLMADHYYARFTELCHQQGIFAYAEPYDRGPMEEMQIGARVDVNMGEFWHGLSSLFQNNWTMRRTTKLAASIAHINGKNAGGGTPANPQLVGAEAFTGEPESARWQEYPFGMKALGDRMFTQGLNRIIFHRYAHQPHPTAVPGMTMGPWGIHFDRTTTWWNQGRAWLDYLARCQSLLQQGLFVADLAYFTGEAGNQYTKVEPHELTPTPPQGYDYDLINGETLLKRTRVQDGKLVLPDGLSYRILVLQNHKALSLPLLRKLRDYVNEGLVVVGEKPETTLGLHRHSEGYTEFKQLLTDIWGPINGTAITENKFGKGRVFWGQSILAVLNLLAIRPDVEVTSRSGDAPITWIHRRIGEVQVYFLANQRRTVEETVCTFRVAGKQPERWDASTGKMTPMPIYETMAGQTRVPVQFDPSGSVFVVFRTPAKKPLQAISKGPETVLSTKPFPIPTRGVYKDVANTFTISLWAKPELNIMLAPGGLLENVKGAWTDYYAIYPPSGTELYGAGHAACGLTIGRNGVAVWERTTGMPTFRLSAQAPISGWSHVAVVYKDGIPAIYVNGKLIQQGKAGTNIVHPGISKAYLSDGASFYNGDMTEPQVLTEAASDDRIRQLAAQKRTESTAIPTVEIAANGKSGLLFWQNGQYVARDTAGRSTPMAVAGINPPVEITGSWQVRFPANMGTPEQITLDSLIPLNTHEQQGVKHFSGTATYIKTIQIPAKLLPGSSGRRLFLDLGRVEVLASVSVNGKNLGTYWKRPYRIDITDAVQAGNNTLEISVTNLWPNRLIGDEYLPDPDKFTPGGGASGFASLSSGAIVELPAWYKEGKPKPADGRVTFTTWKHYTKESPLLDSGLIGPVVLRVAELKLLS